MAADIIPSTFIKDADFERVAQMFRESLAVPPDASDKLERSLKQLRNLFVLSIELRRIAVETGLHLRILELLRLPEISTGARSEALLALTCLYRSKLLTADNFPVSSTEFLSLIYIGFIVKSSPDSALKSKLACLLALLHHSYVNPSFLLLDFKNQTDSSNNGGSNNQNPAGSTTNWLSALISLISRSDNDMESTSSASSGTNASDEHLSLCLILQIIAHGCQDDHVRDTCLTSFPSLLDTLASLLVLPTISSSGYGGGVSSSIGSSSMALISTNTRICGIDCLAALCRNSQRNSMAVFKHASPDENSRESPGACTNGSTFVQTLLTYTSRDFPLSLQLSASKCLVQICKSLQSLDVWCEFPSPIAARICENLVRLLRPDRPPLIRVEAAAVLTDFVETAVGLQRVTGMCDGLVSVLSSTLASVSSSTSTVPAAIPAIMGKDNKRSMDVALDLEKGSAANSVNGQNLVMGSIEDDPNDLTAPFLNLLASISGNDEYLRRKVSDSAELIAAVFASVRSSSQRVQVAGLRCLLSLSRSAYQLRTTFSDNQASFSKELITIVKTSTDAQVLAACLAVLCNVFLSTSSVKKAFTGIENFQEFLAKIVSFTSNSDLQLRINAVWALMNLSYQGPSSLKHQIFSCLSRENLFTLLSDAKVPQVVTCTLGLIRNLIDGTASEVDTGMAHYGDQVVQSAIWILEGDYAVEVKEQVLRIIANMASGERSRDTLLANDDLLRKVMDYMLHINLNVQMAAVDALTNLTLDSDAGDYVGSLKRWQILETCGFIRVLNEMLTTTTDMSLFVKVKRLIERFSEHRYGLISS